MAKAQAGKVNAGFEGFEQVGTNVHMQVTGDILTIKVNLKHDAGLSASGKSRICATTSGNIAVTPKHKLGFNLYTPVGK